ncbi:hypothetical protein ABZ479_41400 [Streptomyces sp. NPDC005722]
MTAALSMAFSRHASTKTNDHFIYCSSVGMPRENVKPNIRFLLARGCRTGRDLLGYAFWTVVVSPAGTPPS